MSEHKNIMIYSDSTKDDLSSEGKELLGGARRLADTIGEQVLCLLVGKDAEMIATQAIAYGADMVLCVTDVELNGDEGNSKCQILEQVVKTYLPRILLFSQKNGDLATYVGFKLGVAVCTGCVGLEIKSDTKKLLQTRLVYGGNARGIFTSRKMPQISTVRNKAMSPLEYDGSRNGTINFVQVTIDPSKPKIKKVGKITDEEGGARVENASVIVCGGRGLGGPGPFNTVLKDLADVLGGVVGSSRPPADNGWVPKALHIGLTGKIVSPSLYIAVAVSGSTLHMAGCFGAKLIVAINKDPEANIFKECDYGVVGSYEEVVPSLTAKVKELKKQ